ncbi:MAG: hypothetical protein JO345_00275 [Streptosporangiaceae bacterium]|nr:hypothetical protein [Streptosporangiaceae bacterium]
MAATLQEMLLAPETRPKVIADCHTLIEQEVSDMSGISGTAVKLAYKTVVVFSPGHVRYMVETLLPRMTEELEPYWADFSTADGSEVGSESGSESGSEFGRYLAERSEEVSQALLSVTDARGAASNRPVITKAYGAVRDKAARHVTAALPRVGALVQKYAI